MDWDDDVVKKLAVSSVLALFLIAPATAHAEEAAPNAGSSSREVLCSAIGPLLLATGSAQNSYEPPIISGCGQR